MDKLDQVKKLIKDHNNCGSEGHIYLFMDERGFWINRLSDNFTLSNCLATLDEVIEYLTPKKTLADYTVQQLVDAIQATKRRYYGIPQLRLCSDGSGGIYVTGDKEIQFEGGHKDLIKFIEDNYNG